MDTALFTIERIHAADEQMKIIDAETWTPKGESVKLQICVGIAHQRGEGSPNSSDWQASGVVFRSLGKQSDGWVAHFQPQSGQKKGKAQKTKLKKEVHFSSRCLKGDMAKIGEDKLELQLRSESSPQFDCKLLIQRNTDVFLIIPDENDGAAIAAFCG